MLSAQLLPSAFLRDVHSPIRPIPPSLYSPMLERQHDWGGIYNAANFLPHSRKFSVRKLSVRKARFFSPPQKSSLFARFGPDCHIKFLSSSQGGREGGGSPFSPSQWLEKVTPGERTPNLILLRHKESVEKRGGTYFGSPLKRGGGDPPLKFFFLVAAAYVRLFWRGLKPPSPSRTQRSPPKKLVRPKKAKKGSLKICAHFFFFP